MGERDKGTDKASESSSMPTESETWIARPSMWGQRRWGCQPSGVCHGMVCMQRRPGCMLRSLDIDRGSPHRTLGNACAGLRMGWGGSCVLGSPRGGNSPVGKEERTDGGWESGFRGAQVVNAERRPGTGAQPGRAAHLTCGSISHAARQRYRSVSACVARYIGLVCCLKSGTSHRLLLSLLRAGVSRRASAQSRQRTRLAQHSREEGSDAGTADRVWQTIANCRCCRRGAFLGV